MMPLVLRCVDGATVALLLVAMFVYECRRDRSRVDPDELNWP
jgi:hypothetical protein